MLESCCVSALELFSKISLAVLLKCNNNQLNSFMIMTGLGRFSKGSMCSNRKEWESFLIAYGIEGAYFDQMKVSNIPNGEGGYCMYR